MDSLNMIVVEGMDNTGKTSLVNHLATRYSLPVIHSAGPRDMLGSFRWVRAALNHHRHHIIFDRFALISEAVYGTILRGVDMFENPAGLHLWDTFRRLDPIIIYCRPHIGVVTNFGDRAQMEGVVDRATQLYSRYEEVMADRVKTFLPFDFTVDSDYEKIDQAVDLMLLERGYA